MEKYLIGKLSEGNHEAFNYIFNKFFSKVKAFANDIVKDIFVAEEITQDVFLKIWTNKSKITTIQTLEAYIFSMTKNQSLNYLRSKKVQSKYFASIKIEDFTNEFVNDAIHHNELQLLINMFLNKLPPQRKKVFFLSKYEGLSNQEIADKLEISKKTTENHLYIAIKDLKEYLSPILGKTIKDKSNRIELGKIS